MICSSCFLGTDLVVVTMVALSEWTPLEPTVLTIFKAMFQNLRFFKCGKRNFFEKKKHGKPYETHFSENPMKPPFFRGHP